MRGESYGGSLQALEPPVVTPRPSSVVPAVIWDASPDPRGAMSGRKIINGLKEAIAHASGDHTIARVRVVPHFTTYNGPPLWIMSDELTKEVALLPEDSTGIIKVQITMIDGRRVNTVVYFDRLVDLPAPYTCRDIVEFRKLY